MDRSLAEQLTKRTLGLITASSPLDELLDRVFKRYSKLRRYRKIKFLEKTKPRSPRKPEASQYGKEIWIYPKFWVLSKDVQESVIIHEIGHYVLLWDVELVNMIKVAETYGVDVWDTNQLPYGMPNSDEAFAESFAAYFVDPSHLKRNHPEWYKIVDHFVK